MILSNSLTIPAAGSSASSGSHWNQSSSRPKSSNRWNYYKDFASIVCSRESTYRTALDISGFDIPALSADIFRGPKKFLETLLEAFLGTTMVIAAPVITTLVGKVLANFILEKDDRKDALNYLRFSMKDLRENNLKGGVETILEEEASDKRFTASLYKNAGNTKKAEKYESDAKDIERFCKEFKPSEKLRKQIYALKKATLIGESFIEGGWWGGFGLLTRAFRKYVLKEDRFTGTMNYASDSESASLGESGDLSLFQKVLGGAAIFISPVLNTFLLNKIEDQNAVKNSKFLKIVQDQMDMTHGVYPKLGMLFSITTIPKWFSAIVTSQGWYEMGERILKLCTILPSWWLGHRATNGLVAKHYDAKLAEKYKVEKGILVEKEYLEHLPQNSTTLDKISQRFPEPARIQHIMKATKDNKTLQSEAEDLHAKCLYKGFGMHSLMIWIINMAVNQITKLRVQSALSK